MMPIRRNQGWLPSIFKDIIGDEWIEKSAVTAPAVNVIDTENQYKVEIAAPGMTKDDFRIDVGADGELVISMEKKSGNEEKNGKDTYLRREFSYSQFRQSLLLPDNVKTDDICAKVENGVLTIDIPKKKESEKIAASRRIEIK